MYTVDDDKRNEIDDDEIIEESSWNNSTGLIIKIIIIVLCVLVLVWLIKALKNNSGTKDNGESHNANVLKVRLAAEEYFFLKNKKENYSVVNLKELKSYGLVDNVVDANNKVCSETNSKVLLDKGSNSYKMTIKLDCSTSDDDEVFYYYTSNLACQNCNGKTIMTGNTNIADKEKEDAKKEEKEEDNNDNSNISNDNGEQEGISCVDWSDWSKDRIYDSSLIERTKTLVQGVKYGNVSTRIDYGNWSDYTSTKIDASDNIEVETKQVQSEKWSSPKTGTDIDINSKKIKVIGTNTETDTVSCPKDYKLVDDKCYSNNEYIGNLTYKEFNSGKYKVNNGLCEGVKNIKYSNGRYELTYINCRYNAILNQDNSKASKTIYTYQELISSNVTYYRYRTVTKTEVRENDIYTNQKYEEKDLPEGYVKVPGTEETFYSYKLESCEK